MLEDETQLIIQNKQKALKQLQNSAFNNSYLRGGYALKQQQALTAQKGETLE